jgi:hypothetical protein
LGFEGEAKCDLAGELSIPGFSYKEMAASECQKLQGLKIDLWRDKDTAGEKQVQDAAQKIHDSGHPRSIALIIPPAELPVGGDIIDRVKALGMGRAQIDELIRNAPEWKQQDTAGAAPVEKDEVASTGTVESDGPIHITMIGDMRETVLSGRLGELYQRNMRDFPIAYAWPAIVTCAGSLVSGSDLRSNLYTGLVGAIGTGKSQANDRSMRNLGIDPRGDEPPVME